MGKKYFALAAILMVAFLCFNGASSVLAATNCQTLTTQITNFINQYGNASSTSANFKSAYDMNGDGYISPMDVLAAMNSTDAVCAQKLTDAMTNCQKLSTQITNFINQYGSASSTSANFKSAYDMNGDNNISPMDVLAAANSTEAACSQKLASLVLPSITVTSPNGGETLTAGQTYNLNWNFSGITPGSKNIDIDVISGSTQYKIFSAPQPIGPSGAGSVQYQWKVGYIINSDSTIPAGSQYKIKVYDKDNPSLSDISDNYFNIVSSKVVCNTNSDCGTSGVQSLCEGNNAIYKNITYTCNNPGTINSSCASSTITMLHNVCPNGQTCANGLCSGPVANIKVTSPAGGEKWAQGSVHNITWTSTGLSNPTVNISLMGNGISNNIASNISASLGSYSWTVPTQYYGDSTIGDNLAISVYDINNSLGLSNVGGISNYFSIVAGQAKCKTLVDQVTKAVNAGISSCGNAKYNPSNDVNGDKSVTPLDVLSATSLTEAQCDTQLSNPKNVCPFVTIVSPNGGEQLSANSQQVFKFTLSNFDWKTFAYQINLINSSGTSTTIFNNYNANTAVSQTSALIPSYMKPGNYKAEVKFMSSSYQTISDTSDNYFSIIPVCTPNWQIGPWSACVNSTQTRTVTDTNLCGVLTGKPAISQACTMPCSVVDVYSQIVPGYVYYNVYIKAQNLSAANTYKIAGADSWSGIGFTVQTRNADGSVILKGNQTFNSISASYIVARKKTIVLNNLTGKTVCTPINLPPVVSNIAGPTSLTVAQNGSYAVNATDPEGKLLNYTVDWGDGQSGSGTTSGSTVKMDHSYNLQGSYTIKFTAKDDIGQLASSSLLVTVSSQNTHKACNAQQQCAIVSGAGTDTCSVNFDCQPISHTECQNQKCVAVPTPGMNLCVSDSDCRPTSHNECQNQQCVVVPMPGVNSCNANADCSPAGQITASVDTSTPPSQVVAGNQKIKAAVFKFTATGEDFTVNEIKVALPSQASSAVVLNAELLDGTTVVGTAPFSNENNTVAYVAGLTIKVPANTSKLFTVNLNLTTPSSDYGTTGKNVKVKLPYLKIINSSGAVSTITPNVSGNDIYVFKSFPTFTALPLSNQGANLSSGSTTSLFSVRIAADQHGNVTVKQLKFLVVVADVGQTTNPSLSQFKLFRGSTDITSSVTIQNASAVSLESQSPSITGNSLVVATFDTEEQIPAGNSYDYTLKATPSNFRSSSSGNDTVYVSLPLTDLQATNVDSAASNADSSATYLTGVSNTNVKALSGYPGQTTGMPANVIWSDNSAISHSYMYNNSSADWFNGYLIPNLPLSPLQTTVALVGASSNLAEQNQSSLDIMQSQLASIADAISRLIAQLLK